MTRIPTPLAAAACVAALALPATAPASGEKTAPARAAAVTDVRLQNFDVRPEVVRIRRGDVVKWRFLDGVSPHNVVSRGKQRFRGSRARRSGTHRVRFRRPGTYRYLCTIHPDMRGRVIVR